MLHLHGLLKPKVLYVTDLDGTLLDRSSRISDKTSEMLNRAIARGTMFTMATARTPATVVPLMSRVSLQLPGVVMTGASQFDFKESRFLNCHTFDPGSAEALLQIYDRMHSGTFVYFLRHNHLDVYHPGEMNEYEMQFAGARNSSDLKKFHLDTPLPSSMQNVVLMFGIRPWTQAKAVHGQMKQSGIPCNPLCYHDMYGDDWGAVEVFSPMASKARSVEQLASDTGAGRIVAFGDNINDIPLLELADTAVAVDNALPEVKQVADLVIGPNTCDSVAAFILNESNHP